MTWRQIHSSVAVSESLAALSSDAERLYWRMLSQTDAWGRLEGTAAKVRARCSPLLDWNVQHVEMLLIELEMAHRIARQGETCQLIDFDKHQPLGARRRGNSAYPEVPVVTPEYVGSARELSGVVGSAPADSRGRFKGDERIEKQERTEPNGSALVVIDGVNSQTLVAEYIDAAKAKGVDVPKRVIGQLARNIKELLEEGQTPDRVRAGLARMAERRVVIPSSLGNFVMEAALPAPRKDSRVSPSEIMAHALQLEREGA